MAELTPRQRLLALDVARGASVRRSAERHKIPLRTARRWSALAAFKAEVRRIGDDLIRRSVTRKAALLARADRRLAALLKDPDPMIGIRAVKIANETLIAMRGHDELAERLAEIRELLGDARPPQPQGATPED